MILTIGREYGSGGHDIGVKLSEKLGLKLYDKQRLREEAKASGLYEEMQMFYDEEPVNSLLYAIAQNNCVTEVGKIPFNHIREIAHREPCIIIGRCASHILRDDADVVSVFIHADPEKRMEKISRDNQLSPAQARKMIEKEDKSRENFFHYYTGRRWKDLSNYHLCLDSGILGLDKTVQMILDYLAKLSDVTG